MKPLILLFALSLTGCASHRPASNATQPPSKLEHFPRQETQNDSINPFRSLQTAKNAGAEYHANATQTPGILSGIGNLFSTPQGRVDRQAVRLAKASVPHSIGKGAVYAINSKVATGYKAKGPTVQADSGAIVSNAASNAQQQTVRGDGNKLQAKQANPTTEAPGPLAVLAQNLTGWIPWAIGGALVLAVVFRKRLPVIGPFFS